MNIMTEKNMKYVKAVTAALSCIGVVVTPEQTDKIFAGFMAVYTIVSGVQSKFKK